MVRHPNAHLPSIADLPSMKAVLAASDGGLSVYCHSGTFRLIVTLFVCVKLSSMLCNENPRPMPLCLTPPYKWPGTCPLPWLTCTHPASMA